MAHRYESIIWNGCHIVPDSMNFAGLILHVVFLYRIRTDILKLSSFTQKTIWSQKNSTKNIRTEIKTLTLHLIFFFQIYTGI